jgi:hypothetical protein
VETIKSDQQSMDEQTTDKILFEIMPIPLRDNRRCR